METDQAALVSAHPDDMTPNEPTTQALLAGLHVQDAVDGDLALHALLDSDLHHNG